MNKIDFKYRAITMNGYDLQVMTSFTLIRLYSNRGVHLPPSVGPLGPDTYLEMISNRIEPLYSAMNELGPHSPGESGLVLICDAVPPRAGLRIAGPLLHVEAVEIRAPELNTLKS